MPDEGSGKADNRRIVTAKEMERRLRAANRKKFFLRAAFLLACAAVIAGIVFLTVTLVNVIKNRVKSADSDRYYCSAYQLENVGNGEVVSTGEDIFVLRDGVLSCVKNTGATLWNETLGESGIRMLPYKNGIAVYAVGGKYLRCFTEAGLAWERIEEEPISFAVLNPESSNALLCTEPEGSSSRIVYFSTKNAKAASETLLEKNYSSNHVIGAAISPGGKSIAVTEISDGGEAAATRVSVIDVSSGRSFFSKVVEEEVCPYCTFAGETRLVCAGRKNVYLVDKIDKNNARSARFSSLMSLGDTGSDVLCLLAVDTKIAVSYGGDGRSDIRIFDLGNGSERSFTVPRNVKEFLKCGSDVFVCCTQADFMVYDFEGNKLSVCEEKLDIETVNGDENGHFVLNGIYGTVIVEVKTAE